jgi:hypothetical protein
VSTDIGLCCRRFSSVNPSRRSLFCSLPVRHQRRLKASRCASHTPFTFRSLVFLVFSVHGASPEDIIDNSSNNMANTRVNLAYAASSHTRPTTLDECHTRPRGDPSFENGQWPLLAAERMPPQPLQRPSTQTRFELRDLAFTPSLGPESEGLSLNGVSRVLSDNHELNGWFSSTPYPDNRHVDDRGLDRHAGEPWRVSVSGDNAQWFEPSALSRTCCWREAAADVSATGLHPDPMVSARPPPKCRTHTKTPAPTQVYHGDEDDPVSETSTYHSGQRATDYDQYRVVVTPRGLEASCIPNKLPSSIVEARNEGATDSEPDACWWPPLRYGVAASAASIGLACDEREAGLGVEETRMGGDDPVDASAGLARGTENVASKLDMPGETWPHSCHRGNHCHRSCEQVYNDEHGQDPSSSTPQLAQTILRENFVASRSRVLKVCAAPSVWSKVNRRRKLKH